MAQQAGAEGRRPAPDPDESVKIGRGEFIRLALLGIGVLAGGGTVIALLEKGGFFAKMAEIYEGVRSGKQAEIDGGVTTVEEATRTFTPTVTQEALDAGVPEEIVTEVVESTPVPTFTPAPTETEVPIREFPVTSIENFKDSVITREDLPDYYNWLKQVVAPTLAPEFKRRYQEGTMQTDVPITFYSFGATSYLAHEKSASFRDENTRPFMRQVTFAYMPADFITQEMKDAGYWATGHLVSTTFMYEVTNQETGDGIVHPIITLTVSNYEDTRAARAVTDAYEVMNEPIFITEPMSADGYTDSVVAPIFERFNRSSRDMETRMRLFQEKEDLGALSEPGMAILTDVIADIDWFRD